MPETLARPESLGTSITVDRHPGHPGGVACGGGAGRARLPQEKLDSSVSTVLSDPRITERTAALGPRIVDDRGVETSCELIEGHVNGKVSGERTASGTA
ncbi:hypothetical protein B7755_042950 [Streptomyces sp. NBS 14/10]|uniref:hypothetical protein n=1 Tax=Streptomyces sp. NBS 14/10 TaxID=1945643 RepID=UPI0015C5BB4F|nr:hypothetical protein [Streptomyces sp. NBS 14/10]KAK1184282.1 hypothetical protein B7755_042950 [Streptomyces sp. NBS 14/10]